MNSRELFLKQSLESINSDLKFAETKNTFLVTVNLAVIGAILTAFVTGKIDFTNTNRVGMLFAGLGVITLIATFFLYYLFCH